MAIIAAVPIYTASAPSARQLANRITVNHPQHEDLLSKTSSPVGFDKLVEAQQIIVTLHLS